MSLLVPENENQAVEIVRDAKAHREPLAIQGGGTHAGLGRPMQTAAALSTKALRGIIFHEPAEMVIRARAGTPLAEIEAALASKGQMLPFEPMDHRGIFGSQGEPSVGAVAACNISGPRRIRNGAARDSLIGVRFINGSGEAINSGGRVMKNVTGLDLVKLQCGAWGTLGLLTEVTFKVIPVTQTEGTLVLEGLNDAAAIAVMSAALGSPFEVSGAAHEPGANARTFLRIEHFAPSVDYRLGELEKLLSKFATSRRLDRDTSQSLWRDIRGVTALSGDLSKALWRVSVAPSQATHFVQTLRERGLAPDYVFDWGGGLIWLAVSASGDAGASHIRTALSGTSGHATLVRAPDDVRQTTDVFQPQSAALMKLTRGVKASMDIAGIFNPGRMYAGV